MATPQSSQGDVPCSRGLRATCTPRCPRLPVSPPSLAALGPQVYRIRLEAAEFRFAGAEAHAWAQKS